MNLLSLSLPSVYLFNSPYSLPSMFFSSPTTMCLPPSLQFCVPRGGHREF